MSNKNVEIQQIPLTKLVSFPNHPYFVPDQDAPSIQALAESIKVNGVMTPVTVRKQDDKYEIISGHRRRLACEVIGLRDIPAIVREYKNDDEAMSAVVEANLDRKELLPSDKARVYRTRYELLKHQGQATVVKNGEKINGQTLEVISKAVGESPKSVQRYMNLSRLIPELLQMIDNQKLSSTCGFELYSLPEDQQRMIFDVLKSIDDVKQKFTLSKARELKKIAKTGNMTDEKIKEILFSVPEVSVNNKVITLDINDLKEYIDTGINEDDIKIRILDLLDKYGMTD